MATYPKGFIGPIKPAPKPIGPSIPKVVPKSIPSMPTVQPGPRPVDPRVPYMPQVPPAPRTLPPQRTNPAFQGQLTQRQQPAVLGETQSTKLHPKTPDVYKQQILKAAQDQDVPPEILSSLLYQESGFNPNAKSPVGAGGIAQFMPGTAQGYGIDPYDPNQAIPAAAKYLRNSYNKFGSWPLALAAYNAGGGAVGKYGGIPPYPETQNYVKNIMAMAGMAVPAAQTVGKTVGEAIQAPEVQNVFKVLADNLKKPAPGGSLSAMIGNYLVNKNKDEVKQFKTAMKHLTLNGQLTPQDVQVMMPFVMLTVGDVGTNPYLDTNQTVGQSQVASEKSRGMDILTTMNDALSKGDIATAKQLLEQAKQLPQYKDYISSFEDLINRFSASAAQAPISQNIAPQAIEKAIGDHNWPLAQQLLGQMSGPSRDFYQNLINRVMSYRP